MFPHNFSACGGKRGGGKRQEATAIEYGNGERKPGALDFDGESRWPIGIKSKAEVHGEWLIISNEDSKYLSFSDYSRKDSINCLLIKKIAR